MWQRKWHQTQFANLKNENQSAALREVFIEFCENSTIHGIRYLGDEKRHWSERIWWVFAISLSICLCGFSIRSILNSWNETPVMMSLTEKHVPISAIPFPTVTICPETKTLSSKLNVTSAYELLQGSWAQLTEIEVARIEALIHLCEFYMPNVLFSNFFTNESIYDLIEDMAPTLQDTFRYCMWEYIVKPCPTYFTPILTDEGLCFSFNALNSRDIYTDEVAPEMLTVDQNPNVSHWSLEEGYVEKLNGTNYPFRVFNARQSASLAVFLSLNPEDLDYVCRSLIPGFKIYLHTPGEVSPVSHQSFRLPLCEEAELSIKPKLIYTSVGLRSYKPIERQCYFNSERQLRFFKFYSQSKCEIECLSNFTEKVCGCVKFSMPRFKTTKICGAAKLKCYENAEKKLFGEDVIDGITDNKVKKFRQNCQCLPGCTTVNFDAEIDRAKLDLAPTLGSYKNAFEMNDRMRPSVVTVFFRNHHVETYKRVEVYTYTNFLAICGGLLGLFLGVSALSIIEFIYYSTLRLFWTYRKWKSQHVVKPMFHKPRPANSLFIDISNSV